MDENSTGTLPLTVDQLVAGHSHQPLMAPRVIPRTLPKPPPRPPRHYLSPLAPTHLPRALRLLCVCPARQCVGPSRALSGSGARVADGIQVGRSG